MHFNQVVEKLNTMQQRQGSHYGTARTRALLDALGSPDEALKIIHVAASNGKGSICEYITRILAANGNTVGTFTSPAVFCFAEQFRINGANCEQSVLARLLTEVDAVAQTFADKPTAFEIQTAAALLLFYRAGCEYAVLECGLGGLTDATNAVNGKQVAVIGSVSLEHTAVLGNTVTEICRQKAGIIQNCPAVISAYQCEEALAYFSQITPAFSGEGLQITQSDAQGQTFLYGGQTYRINMLGKAQCYNAAVAIDCCRILGAQPYAIVEGLAVARLAGRLQTIRKNGKTYLLDGSHNPAAFAPLIEWLQKLERKENTAIVFGCLSDKDAQTAAALLAPYAGQFAIVTPPSYRAMQSEIVAQLFMENGAKVTCYPNVEGALLAMNTETVVVCGTFTHLAEAKKWIDNAQSTQ